MADVDCHVVRDVNPTGSGPTDFDIVAGSSFDDQKAAIILSLNKTTDGTATGDDARVSIGFTDGTTDKAVAAASDHGVGTSNCSVAQQNRIWLHKRVGGGTIAQYANFKQWTTDGLTATYTGTSFTSREHYLVSSLFGGADCQAAVGSMAATNGTSVTGLGWKPDAIFFTTGGLADSITENDFSVGFGCAVRDVSDDSTTQACTNHWEDDGQSTTVVTSKHSSADCIGHYTSSSQWNSQLSSWDSGGFTIATTGSPSTDVISYLALKFNGVDFGLIDEFTTKSSTGTKTYTTTSTPQSVIGSLTALIAANTASSSGPCEAMSYFAFDASSEFAQCHAIDDNVATSAIDVMNDSKAITLGRDSGSGYADIAVATLDSFNATDFTLDYSVAPSNAVYGWAFWLGENTGSASNAMPMAIHHYQMAGGL